MRPNCPLCGRHLSLEEARDRENTIIAPNGVEIVVCTNCGKKGRLKEQIPTAPYTPPGPPEATVEKQVEALELRLDLMKTQIIGILETLATLGYDVSAFKGGDNTWQIWKN